MFVYTSSVRYLTAAAEDITSETIVDYIQQLEKAGIRVWDDQVFSAVIKRVIADNLDPRAVSIAEVILDNFSTSLVLRDKVLGSDQLPRFDEQLLGGEAEVQKNTRLNEQLDSIIRQTPIQDAQFNRLYYSPSVINLISKSGDAEDFLTKKLFDRAVEMMLTSRIDTKALEKQWTRLMSGNPDMAMEPEAVVELPEAARVIAEAAEAAEMSDELHKQLRIPSLIEQYRASEGLLGLTYKDLFKEGFKNYFKDSFVKGDVQPHFERSYMSAWHDEDGDDAEADTPKMKKRKKTTGPKHQSQLANTYTTYYDYVSKLKNKSFVPLAPNEGSELFVKTSDGNLAEVRGGTVLRYKGGAKNEFYSAMVVGYKQPKVDKVVVAMPLDQSGKNFIDIDLRSPDVTYANTQVDQRKVDETTGQ